VGVASPPGGFEAFMKSAIVRDDGLAILDGIIGLAVYDVSRQTVFIYGNDVSFRLGRDVDRLRSELKTSYPPLELTPKQETAYELLAATQFETTHRSKFLSLMLSIESLLNQTKLSSAAQELLANLVKQISTSSLDEREKQSMIDKIKFADREAIRQSAKRRAIELLATKTYLKKEAGEFALWLYDIRSDLVHNGTITKRGVDLRDIIDDAQRFAGDLLEASLREMAPTV
jgi:hypothetical protein